MADFLPSGRHNCIYRKPIWTPTISLFSSYSIVQAAPMSNWKVEAKNLCTARLKLKAMKTNNSCVLAFEKCSYQLSLWFTIHNVIIEEVNKVEDIERRHNCTHNVRTENRLPIKHIIGALQPHSHSYTATHTHLPSGRWVLWIPRTPCP